MKFILIFIALSLSLFAENNYSTKSNWLVDSNSSSEKFQKIQKQLRGFDVTMVEVGERFNTFYFAIKDKNYELATYQWDKIKKTIKNGTIRRPAREANSQAMFLDTQYKSMSDALAKKDEKLVLKEYEQTKRVCNACHVAERVPFIELIDPEYRWLPIR